MAKLHPAFGGCPQSFTFFKNLIYQKQCKYAMNIGLLTSKGPFIVFYRESVLLYLCQMLPSISKIAPDVTKQSLSMTCYPMLMTTNPGRGAAKLMNTTN